jgi:hypothetical protein
MDYRRLRATPVVAGIALLVAITVGIALSRSDDDSPAAGLTIDWRSSEGHPGCVYDPKANSVDAELTIDGYAPRRKAVTVTVTAYADENTSEPVGSSSRTVLVEGNVHQRVSLTIPVEKAPHVGEDDVAACARSVKY